MPRYVAPGAKRIVSPGCAESMAACRLPPAATEIVLPPPDGGGGAGGVGGGVGVPPAVNTRIERKLRPGASKSTVSCCVPAPSVTGIDTVVHDGQSPVAGIERLVQTLLGPLKPTCIAPPP